MPQHEDADRISELMRLLGIKDLPEVQLWQILPAGGIGYAQDHGRVIGIKLWTLGEHSQRALDIILQFAFLERLVFEARDQPGVRVPRAITALRHLNLLWMEGSLRSLPSELFRLNLPLSIHPSGLDQDPARGNSERIELDETESEYSRHLNLLEDTAAKTTQDYLNIYAARERRIAQSRSQPHELQSIMNRSLALRGIFLDGTNLEDPPLEIARKGREAIQTYFRGREEGDLPLNEIKVLLVGNGSAGKTSLVKKMFGEAFNPTESQTHGINIRSSTFNTEHLGDMTANFWDFGGQEIMHATHQFFLSKRSLYILVLDGRKEEDAEYWLQHIESFGGESPILLVLNKIDENPAFEINRRFLATKYKTIAGFYRTSCANNIGIKDLKDGIQHHLETVPILQTLWPLSWFRVKERLKALSNAYISIKDYTLFCEQEGIKDQTSQDTLVDFLHDLGTILHFRDLQLLDTHVLDPRWVTGAVYRIITAESLAAQKGTLYLNDIASLLKDHPGDTFRYASDKHTYIIEMMLKFELCYRLDRGSLLVPDLLDVQEPELDFRYQDALRFVLRYTYLPKSIMPRFIVRMNADIKGTKRWRTGVQLDDMVSKATAVVRTDEKAKRIDVFVNGEQRREYFAVIRKVLNDINGSFERLQVTECVPLPDAPEVEIEYSELIGYELAGREEIFVGRLRRAYQVDLLLNGIEEANRRRENYAQTVINVMRGDYIAQSGAKKYGTDFDGRADQSGPGVGYQSQTWEKVVMYTTGLVRTLKGTGGYDLQRT